MTAFSDHPQSRPATGWPLVLRQTTALFGDAVRRLRAAKLFWVALVLSALVAAAIGIVGIDETGWSVPFLGHVDDPINNTQFQTAAEYYRSIFIFFGVSIWLTYGATLLGLVSTANLVPSLIDEGSVDLYLARPVGRVRLFLTRYVTGLLFVAGQAFCFSVVAIAIFAVRAQVFLPDLLWSVFYATLLFSFLYCVSAFVGLVSGSLLAAILTTGMLWAFIFVADWTEYGMLTWRETARAGVAAAERAQLQAEQVNERFNGPDSAAGDVARDTAALQLDAAAGRLASARDSLATATRIHRITYVVKAPLPKLGETVGVMRRHLEDASTVERKREAELAEGEANVRESVQRNDRLSEEEKSRQQAMMLDIVAGGSEADRLYDGRSLWWSIGTGLAFEAVLVGLCCLIFWRRDLA